MRGMLPGNVIITMLAIRVKVDKDVGTLRQREIDHGLQRGALAEVDGVADDCRRPFRSQLRCAVDRPVIDNDDVISSLAKPRQH